MPREPSRRKSVPREPLGLWIGANVAGLLAVSIALRLWGLDHVPGLNGDEAWYGVQAEDFLAGRGCSWRTPTGNLINPLFFGPLLATHLLAGPSAAALRGVAVLSGVAALAVNWLLCRRVFNPRVAWISTLALAVLPINIAYSRFAWDASQTLLVTLPVLYASLGAVRFTEHRGRWLTAACLVAVLAVVVHPANVFASSAILSAAALLLARRGAAARSAIELQQVARPSRWPLGMIAALAAAGALLLVGLYVVVRPDMLSTRLAGVGDLSQRNGLWFFVLLYPRLLSGATVYEYLAGSTSFLQWPAQSAAGGLGLDVLIVWLLIGWALWRTAGEARRGSDVDRCLLGAWGLSLVGFLLVAGPSGLVPGYERYGLCMVAPAVVLVSRALERAVASADAQQTWSPLRYRAILLVGLLAGWLLLAGFHRYYLQFIVCTGGESHRTFRTAAVEPKLAALQTIERSSAQQPAVVLANEYWLYWPLRYYAARSPAVTVVETADSAEPSAAVQWRVEFADSKLAEQVRSGTFGPVRDEITLGDAAGRPLLSLFRMAPPERPSQSSHPAHKAAQAMP